MGNESAIRIAERVIEAINERNRDAIEELAHPEVQLRMPPAMVFYGPDGVHRQSVARSILKDYRAPEGTWPSEHVPTRREAAHRKFAHLLEESTANL